MYRVLLKSMEWNAPGYTIPRLSCREAQKTRNKSRT